MEDEGGEKPDQEGLFNDIVNQVQGVGNPWGPFIEIGQCCDLIYYFLN